jgi:hypothetical protein
VKQGKTDDKEKSERSEKDAFVINTLEGKTYSKRAENAGGVIGNGDVCGILLETDEIEV